MYPFVISICQECLA